MVKEEHQYKQDYDTVDDNAKTGWQAEFFFVVYCF